MFELVSCHGSTCCFYDLFNEHYGLNVVLLQIYTATPRNRICRLESTLSEERLTNAKLSSELAQAHQSAGLLAANHHKLKLQVLLRRHASLNVDED